MKELEDIISSLEKIYRETGNLDVGIEKLRLMFLNYELKRKMKLYRYFAISIAVVFLIQIFTYLK